MNVSIADRTDVSEPTVDERALVEPSVPGAASVGSMPPHHERRTAHAFREAEGSREGRAAGQVPCVVCGYAEADHPTLTDPERKIVAALVNQRQAPAFMRRSILRKVASSLHIR